IVNPGNIRFASRIANNRICVYLSSKSIVEKIVTEKLSVEVRGRTLPVRPLTTKAKRVILSNVCPVIPHAVLESALKKVGVRLLSSISFVRAGFVESGFSQILSFRRQVYIHPDDETKLPEYLRVNFENTKYWIFVSSGKLICFLCKKEGHMARQCRAFSNGKSSSTIDSSPSRVDQILPEDCSLDPLDTRADLPSSAACLRNERSAETNKPVKRSVLESASTEPTRAASEIPSPSEPKVANATSTEPKPASDLSEFAEPTAADNAMTPGKKKLRKINNKKWIVLCNQ
ncbi:uncharacterized protein LOC144477830, partial [Augochlora pura]